jgi:starch synthase
MLIWGWRCPGTVPTITCTVHCGWVHGRLCFFIEPHSQDMFFQRGCYYGCDDDPMRFAFFSKAALEFLLRSNKRPDVHSLPRLANGLVPVMLFEIYKYGGMEYQRVLYTIHNFKHQGFGGTEILQATGLNRPEYYFQYDRLRDNFNPFAINFMKGGLTTPTMSTRYRLTMPGKQKMVIRGLAWGIRCT